MILSLTATDAENTTASVSETEHEIRKNFAAQDARNAEEAITSLTAWLDDEHSDKPVSEICQSHDLTPEQRQRLCHAYSVIVGVFAESDARAGLIYR